MVRSDGGISVRANFVGFVWKLGKKKKRLFLGFVDGKQLILLAGNFKVILVYR